MLSCSIYSVDLNKHLRLAGHTKALNTVAVKCGCALAFVDPRFKHQIWQSTIESTGSVLCC